MPSPARYPDNFQRQRFVEEFLVDLNKTEAARRAGYSAKSAHVQGHQLLKDPLVKMALDQALAERSAKVGIKAENVILELATIGLSCIDHYQVDEDGKVTLTEGAPRWAKKAISSLRRRTVTRTTKDGDVIVTKDVELKFWDKNKALELLGKHLKMWSDKDDNKPGDTINNTQNNLYVINATRETLARIADKLEARLAAKEAPEEEE